jgi:hypothetical protein
MLGIYVREASPSTERWVCSVIGDHRIDGLQGEELVVSCLLGKETREVRVRVHMISTLRHTEGDETRMDADSLRADLATAAAATDWLVIDPCEGLYVPFWMSDNREDQVFVQHVVVRTKVQTMVGLPDVQVDLAETDKSDAGLDELLAYANRPPLPASEKPGAILRALAESEPLAQGLVIACETDESKVVVRLDTMLESHVFAARADVCGTRPLRAGDRLHRSINGPSGEAWSAEIAEVTEVLSHDMGA